MPTEPATAEQPAHPVHALTTAELTRYRRQLEGAIKGIDPSAPVQAGLRARLDTVIAEQEQRAKIARGGAWQEDATRA